MANQIFTDSEIAEILNLINATRHTQYIGSRYVPIFGRIGETSIEWDNKTPYEPLTIVLNQGNSYTSRQYVPSGIDITDTAYWANTGNYNAQIEQYRTEAKQGVTANNLLNHMGITDYTTAGEHINAIEDNHNHTQANTDILTTLGITNVSDANRYIASHGGIYTNADAVFFGDSITAGWQPNGVTITTTYAQLLTNQLNWNSKNYAVAGTGWNVANAKNITNQIDTALADTTLTPNNVRNVIIAAGANDGSSQNLETVVPDTIKKALVSFPNAHVWIINFPFGSSPLYWPTGQRDAFLINFRKGFSTLPPTPRLSLIDGIWQVLISQDALVAPDGVHPLDAGHQKIAQTVIQKMYGHDLQINLSEGLTLTTGATVGAGQSEFTCRVINGMVNLSGTIHLSYVESLDTKKDNTNERFGLLAKLPKYCRQYPGKRRNLITTIQRNNVLPTNKYYTYIVTPSETDTRPQLNLADHITFNKDEDVKLFFDNITFPLGM